MPSQSLAAISAPQTHEELVERVVFSRLRQRSDGRAEAFQALAETGAALKLIPPEALPRPRSAVALEIGPHEKTHAMEDLLSRGALDRRDFSELARTGATEGWRPAEEALSPLRQKLFEHHFAETCVAFLLANDARSLLPEHIVSKLYTSGPEVHERAEASASALLAFARVDKEHQSTLRQLRARGTLSQQEEGFLSNTRSLEVRDKAIAAALSFEQAVQHTLDRAQCAGIGFNAKERSRFMRELREKPSLLLRLEHLNILNVRLDLHYAARALSHVEERQMHLLEHLLRTAHQG